VRELEETFN
jgi:hypothetical protein